LGGGASLKKKKEGLKRDDTAVAVKEPLLILLLEREVGSGVGKITLYSFPKREGQGAGSLLVKGDKFVRKGERKNFWRRKEVGRPTWLPEPRGEARPALIPLIHEGKKRGEGRWLGRGPYFPYISEEGKGREKKATERSHDDPDRRRGLLLCPLLRR